jgi:AcrR family transcriptional regulator
MSTTEKRTYRLGKRAEKQAETRQRIVEAAVELHSTVGPARTSLTAIAERAGVQRHTLYAHFPDEQALFEACTAHWGALHPFPDPSAWAAVDNPRERLRVALAAVYSWYDEREPELALFARDADAYPPVHEAERARLDAIADDIAAGHEPRRAVRAAIGHTLEFETWRSLVRTQGLSQAQAIDLLDRLVERA